jgi:hypothetical protein
MKQPIESVAICITFNLLLAEAAVKAGNHIYFHIGKGKHFWGHGYRSLFLSDNSNAYPYF